MIKILKIKVSRIIMLIIIIVSIAYFIIDYYRLNYYNVTLTTDKDEYYIFDGLFGDTVVGNLTNNGLFSVYYVEAGRKCAFDTWMSIQKYQNNSWIDRPPRNVYVCPGRFSSDIHNLKSKNSTIVNWDVRVNDKFVEEGTYRIVAAYFLKYDILSPWPGHRVKAYSNSFKIVTVRDAPPEFVIENNSINLPLLNQTYIIIEH